MRAISLSLAVLLGAFGAAATAQAGSVQHAVPASATHKEIVQSYDHACTWVEKALPDPDRRAYMGPIAKACTAIADGGYLLTPVKGSPPADAAVHFTRTLDRVIEGLGQVYMAMWLRRLNSDGPPGGVIDLNDTGVFLALRHENAYRLAKRVVTLHERRSPQVAGLAEQ